MATITIEVSDDLLEQLSPVKDQLPELLQRCLHPLALPAQVYRYILDFIASQPTPEQIAAFKPSPEMQERLRYLVSREQNAILTQAEKQELDEYEKIEHLIVLLKSKASQVQSF